MWAIKQTLIVGTSGDGSHLVGPGGTLSQAILASAQTALRGLPRPVPSFLPPGLLLRGSLASSLTRMPAVGCCTLWV